MIDNSVRLLRRLAATMAPVVLAGAGYAARDLNLFERAPYYLQVTFSGAGVTVPKTPAPRTRGAAGDQPVVEPLPAQAELLFHRSGKEPRADRYQANRYHVAGAGDAERSGARPYVAASVAPSVAPLTLAMAGPADLYEIDRTRKGDPIVALAGPASPEAAPLAVENAPFARGAETAAAQETPAESEEAGRLITGSVPQAPATPGPSAALFMMASLTTALDDDGDAAKAGAGAVIPVSAPQESPASSSSASPSPESPSPRKGAQDAWPSMVQEGRLSSAQPNMFFGGLSETEFRAREMRCMAIAIYFEARDEPIKGQIAVAQVIMNRVKSPFYPKTICGVIYQGADRRNSCQFSFACDGQADRPTEKKEWATAVDVAKQVTYGKVHLDDIGDATHYHATYVHPDWIRQVRRITRIGGHIFYKASFAPVHVAVDEL